MDSDPEVLGSVHGDLKSLDLTSSTYIGAVPALLDLAAFNMGTSQGLVGCIRRLKWNHRIIRLLLLDSTGCPTNEYTLCFVCFLGFQWSYRGSFYHFSIAQET